MQHNITVETGTVSSKSSVPYWALAYTASFLCIGLLTYGYNIMRSLGNRLTYHSPSRGYCMELGAAVAVLTASRMGWPISTTQCITGATLGVGLCARDLGAGQYHYNLLHMYPCVVFFQSESDHIQWTYAVY
jgi:phosphate/sulfate permease